MPDTAYLADEDSLVTVLPYTLGYTPRDSITITALRDHRMVFTGRWALDDEFNAAGINAQTSALLAVARRAHATSSLIIVWTDNVDDPQQLPLAELVVNYVIASERAGITCFNALCVHNERISSYLCPDADCCPHNRPIRRTDNAQRAVELVVLHGGVLHGDRQEILDAVAPTTPVELNTTAAIIDVDELRMMCTNADLRTLPDEQVNSVILSLSALTIRDAFLAHTAAADDTDTIKQMLVVLCDVLRRAPQDWVADVAVTVAALAYLTGKGVLADAALTRAFEDTPNHPLALLVHTTLHGQVEPDLFRETLAGHKD